MSTKLHCCERMNWAIKETEIPISFVAKFREYGLLVDDGGSSSVEIYFCPWCGTKLPLSLRDNWFEKLALLGIDPHDGSIPENFQSDEWYQGS